MIEKETNNSKKEEGKVISSEVGEITPQTIESFLRDEKWEFTLITDGLWKLLFKGKERSFPIFLRMSSDWITVAVIPFTYSPEADTLEAEQLHEKLLKLNQKIHMSKFSIDESGEVMLSVDLPVESLSLSELKEGLDIVAYYSEKYWPEFIHEKPINEV